MSSWWWWTPTAGSSAQLHMVMLSSPLPLSFRGSNLCPHTRSFPSPFHKGNTRRCFLGQGFSPDKLQKGVSSSLLLCHSNPPLQRRVLVSPSSPYPGYVSSSLCYSDQSEQINSRWGHTAMWAGGSCPTPGCMLGKALLSPCCFFSSSLLTAVVLLKGLETQLYSFRHTDPEHRIV